MFSPINQWLVGQNLTQASTSIFYTPKIWGFYTEWEIPLFKSYRAVAIYLSIHIIFSLSLSIYIFSLYMYYICIIHCVSGATLNTLFFIYSSQRPSKEILLVGHATDVCMWKQIQRGWETCPRCHGLLVAELRFEWRSSIPLSLSSYPLQ